MSTPYFGRVWSVTVIPRSTVTQNQPNGVPWTIQSADWSPEPLRLTFDTIIRPFVEWWAAEIVLYNPAPGAQDLIQAGDLVTVSAGYQQPTSERSVIFKGHVFQPVWERVNETDYRLLLRCFVGKWEDDNGQISMNLEAGLTDDEAVRRVAASAPIPIKIDSLDPALADSSTKSIRGTPFQGVARKFFDRVASKHHMLCWIGWNGLVIRSMAPQGAIPNLVYAPPLSPESQTVTLDNTTKYTLIGSPQQTEDGIRFRVLLDSDLQLGALVKLDFSVMRKFLLQPLQRPPRLDKDGLFVVAAIRHMGDSRGQEWYTEITGVTRAYDSIYNAVAL